MYTCGQVLHRDLCVFVEGVVLSRVGVTKGEVVNGVGHVELREGERERGYERGAISNNSRLSMCIVGTP